MAAPALPYFEKHIFFCLNQRAAPQACCANHAAQQAFEHCKQKIHSLGLSGAGKIRVNRAGCLDRCAGGPVCVVYPQGIWYTYVDNSDIDEIIHSHLQNNQIVKRLLLPADTGH